MAVSKCTIPDFDLYPFNSKTTSQLQARIIHQSHARTLELVLPCSVTRPPNADIIPLNAGTASLLIEHLP